MGIDYGTKRVGIALSNEEGTMGFPEAVIENSDDLVGQIADLAEKKEVSDIVIGESKDFKGEENVIMKDIRVLQAELEKRELTVHLEPEFLTSHQAAQIQGEGSMHDASAAALILTSFLSRKQ